MQDTKSISYPIVFHPVYKDYIWGGTRIPEVYGRDVEPGIYAESWEISDRPEGMSVVANGASQGQTLDELCRGYGRDLLGSAVEGTEFPLLIKLIDSKQCLSVQVHPNNDNAEAVGGEAKTEMWYVLDTDEGAQVYAGLKAGTNHETFEKAIAGGTVEELLNAVPVTSGDAIFIPGGRVHAIDAGCLLLEIQQNSNTTYRVYDWGRMGHDGKPRELHVDKALEVITWNDRGQIKYKPGKVDAEGGHTTWEVMDCPLFHVERLDITAEITQKNGGRSFHAFFVAEGAVRITAGGETVELQRGTSCLIPACVSEYSLEPVTDAAAVMRIRLP